MNSDVFAHCNFPARKPVRRLIGAIEEMDGFDRDRLRGEIRGMAAQEITTFRILVPDRAKDGRHRQHRHIQPLEHVVLLELGDELVLLHLVLHLLQLFGERDVRLRQAHYLPPLVDP